MNIITGKLEPDAGKVEWAKNVRVGYLDQHTVLEKKAERSVKSFRMHSIIYSPWKPR
ncbi:hypothetical protein BsIDN1_13810 [Bacillus safensis]|uniref:ABC transporter domain-containing protein n=1 Tax=Bacillus safensis TaxID=561879 RepID=A0A5S9M3P5_BACIA|nr:hypothetical protein BsIDN1_13810 [Bacillus safensis]